MFPTSQASDYKGLRRTLTDKLLKEKEGILAWMILGAVQYLTGGFVPSPNMLQDVQAYRSDSDLLGTFLSEETTSSPAAQIEQDALFDKYRFWCLRGQLHAMSKKSFTLRLAERGYGQSKSGRTRFYVGLE
jgi:putative DNA primase/helicase